MDWLGSVGYIYLMTDIDGLYYAQSVGILSLPKSLNDMADFQSTLDLLFCYRREMLYSGSQATAALAKRQDFEQLCELAGTAKEFSPIPHHNIYFTPTQQRTKTMRSNP
ncbi:hypothetical protein CLU79DRAFT_232921 [Phycomyces nitens]|nr:hypothetical protein CLU79DRAFT_232921 [Phycomyces nitens]